MIEKLEKLYDEACSAGTDLSMKDIIDRAYALGRYDSASLFARVRELCKFIERQHIWNDSLPDEYFAVRDSLDKLEAPG